MDFMTKQGQEPTEEKSENMLQMERQFAIESGQMEEPEEDQLLANPDLEMTVEEVDLKFQELLSEDNYNLMLQYMTTEFVMLLEDLFGLDKIENTVVSDYFRSKVNPEKILIPISRDKLEGLGPQASQNSQESTATELSGADAEGVSPKEPIIA